MTDATRPADGATAHGSASADGATAHGSAPADCSEALSRLFEFLDAEVDELDGDRIRQHLADCEPCLGEYDIEQHLKSLVRRSCHDVAPTELHLRIRQQLTVLRGEVQDRG